MMQKIRWGILSTGNISEQFTSALHGVQDASILGVTSRDMGKSRLFAQKHGISNYYDDPRSMAENKDIDIVYIGTPNASHWKDAELFMEHGKNVLCEKPMGVNAQETEKMIACSKKNNVFLMEAMWTRFFPAVQKGLEWIRHGRIGEPKTLFANLGLDVSDKKDVMWRFGTDMAGGALLDVGIYPLSMASLVFGLQTAEIMTTAVVKNGVDETNTFSLRYPDGRIAVMASSLTGRMDNRLVINGDRGSVTFGDGDWWHAGHVILRSGDGGIFSYKEIVEEYTDPNASYGLRYEAEAVQRHLRAGLKEAPEMPLMESLQIARTMDHLRGKWGVRFRQDEI
jgi:predicted dehydrogenase